MQKEVPGVADRGFVKATCASCQDPDVWLKCDACGRSDHFTFDGETVRCDCGATYDHAVCTCGQEVPALGLSFVDADEGPIALADLEIAWGRVAVLALAVLAAVGALLVWVL